MEFLKRFLNNRSQAESDSGNADLTVMVMFLPLVAGVVLTMIETNFYFGNKSSYEALAEKGANTVSIMGGAGSYTQKTSLEDSFGKPTTRSDIDECLEGSGKSSANAVECWIVESLKEAPIAASSLQDVNCGPQTTASIGDRAYCSIEFTHQRMTLSFLNLDTSHKVTKSSLAEVAYNSLVPRPAN